MKTCKKSQDSSANKNKIDINEVFTRLQNQKLKNFKCHHNTIKTESSTAKKQRKKISLRRPQSPSSPHFEEDSQISHKDNLIRQLKEVHYQMLYEKDKKINDLYEIISHMQDQIDYVMNLLKI